MTSPSTRYPLPDLNTLPEDLKVKILEVQEKSGFIPNVFPGIRPTPCRMARLLCRTTMPSCCARAAASPRASAK